MKERKIVNYLAIDASTEACSVAIQYKGKVYSEYELCPQSHSLRLLPMVDDLLKQAGCQLSELDGLIYGQGPGSFTGVRIGIGVAQGLAFSAELPVVGVSTMQAMAQQAYQLNQSSAVLVAIDARMSEVYNGYYQLDDNQIMQEFLPESVLAPEKVKAHYTSSETLPENASISLPAYVAGTGWEAYSEALSELQLSKGTPEILFPHAEAMLTIGIVKFENGEAKTAEEAQPVYVRDTVSWKKLPGRE